MTWPRLIPVLAVALSLSACPDNNAPGNDRESNHDPAKPPAPLVDVAAVIEGLEPSVLIPEAMTEQEVGTVPAERRQCVFRFTGEGQPIVTYGSGGAVLKLNSKLALVPRAGDSRYGAAGLDMTMRQVDEDGSGDGTVRAEFVLRVPGAAHELGYRGFAECERDR